MGESHLGPLMTLLEVYDILHGTGDNWERTGHSERGQFGCLHRRLKDGFTVFVIYDRTVSPMLQKVLVDVIDYPDDPDDPQQRKKAAEPYMLSYVDHLADIMPGRYTCHKWRSYRDSHTKGNFGSECVCSRMRLTI